MAAFMTKAFARFARKAGIADDTLAQAAADVADGLFDADLGGHVFKQRVARRGGGKSGGFRTIILFKAGGHSFFAHGFAKNEKADISVKELAALKGLAEILLDMPDVDLGKALAAGELVKVNDGCEATEE